MKIRYPMMLSAFLSLSATAFAVDRQTLLDDAGLDIMCQTESYTDCMEIEAEACNARLQACVQDVPEDVSPDRVGDVYVQLEQCFLGGFDVQEQQVDRCDEKFIEVLDAR